MIKAILFDVDGVLVNSKKHNIAYKNQLFESAGYHDMALEFLDNQHKPTKQVIEEALRSKNITSRDEVERVFGFAQDEALRNKIKHLLIFPDSLEEVLIKLKKNYQLGIVTSRIRFGMRDIFGQRPIEKYFDYVGCYEDSKNHKPHPEPLLNACEQLMIKADEAIYIGDMETDILAADAINMRSIHFSEIKHDLAHTRINDFSEIPNAIELISSENSSAK